MNSDVVLFQANKVAHLAQERAAMRKRLEESPNGEYYFPDAKFSDRDPKTAAIHDLVSRLSGYFPEYVWSTSDSFDPEVRGMLVRWSRKPPRITKQTNKEII